uniref:Reverse transcriptase n=1 Tax=Caenorhabditis tropicalis TaxID=1561998 RepID=A0A1I7TNS6_9PELO
MGEEDADYAIKILNMIKLYGKPIKVNKASLRISSSEIWIQKWTRSFFMTHSVHSELFYKFPKSCETWIQALQKDSHSSISPHSKPRIQPWKR